MAFGGDKAEHSLEYLVKAAELKGIRPHSVTRHTIMLVTKSASERSKTVTAARKLGLPVISDDEFEVLLKDICAGDWPIPKKPQFSTLIVEGARVFLSHKTVNEIIKHKNDRIAVAIKRNTKLVDILEDLFKQEDHHREFQAILSM